MTRKNDKYSCESCGHDWDDHQNRILQDGCLCGSCYDYEPTPCKYSDDDDDFGRNPNYKICACPCFVKKSS